MLPYIGYFSLFACALFLDQLTKILVDRTFVLYESHHIFGSYLQLTYVRNSGAAFGISVGDPKIMFAVTVFVTFMLIFLFFRGTLRPENSIGKSAVVLVLSGAIGNIIDRIRIGEVIDFIDMGIGYHRWPVYNFADIYVTIGMIILIATYTLKPDNPEEAASQPSE